MVRECDTDVRSDTERFHRDAAFNYHPAWRSPRPRLSLTPTAALTPTQTNNRTNETGSQRNGESSTLEENE